MLLVWRERERDETLQILGQSLGRHILPKYEMWCVMDYKGWKQWSHFSPYISPDKSLVCTLIQTSQLYICRLLAYETLGRTGMLKRIKKKMFLFITWKIVVLITIFLQTHAQHTDLLIQLFTNNEVLQSLSLRYNHNIIIWYAFFIFP